MMHMRTKLTGLPPITTGGGGGGGGPESWELRPCGMLVQKRVDTDRDIKPALTIRVRVKFGSVYHDIYINSQATFGELKKMLTEATGLHHQDQKVYYKGKERDSKEFLDVVGVKDKSKLVLEEDPISQEKRFLEMRKNAKMEKAAKSVSEISLEVDRLAVQVAALESLIQEGRRVPEKEVVNLIELLMNELIKLDGITADGDVKLQRKMQVRRVQKYVETLDVLNLKNSMPKTQEKPTSNVAKSPRFPQPPRHSVGHSPLKPKAQEEPSRHSVGHSPLKPKAREEPSRHSVGHSPLKPRAQEEERPSEYSTSGTVVTTQWETFESTPPLIPMSTKPASTHAPKLPWDVFA